jgi:hypothetical protein
MRKAFFVILALLTLLASPASFSKSFQPVTPVDFPDVINQNNISSVMAFGYPMAGTGGFHLMPPGPFFRYLSGVQNVSISSWPLALMPPFQAMFRGPTIVNG